MDVLIATASGSAKDHADGKPMAVLGRGVLAATAQATLRRGLEHQAGTATLPAWRNGRIHAIWHSFYNSPFNIVALLSFAKWIHPQLFADVNPGAVLAGLHAEFAPFNLDGTYMITLAK